mmetsp:Transcript_65433/g.122036  ORF Transcript_65433/g.122036 Transcript_65433/m.122036 type:complete len:201 (+) Transcript_65433:2277-2879(+)
MTAPGHLREHGFRPGHVQIEAQSLAVRYKQPCLFKTVHRRHHLGEATPLGRPGCLVVRQATCLVLTLLWPVFRCRRMSRSRCQPLGPEPEQLLQLLLLAEHRGMASGLKRCRLLAEALLVHLLAAACSRCQKSQAEVDGQHQLQLLLLAQQLGSDAQAGLQFQQLQHLDSGAQVVRLGFTEIKATDLLLCLVAGSSYSQP